MLLARLPRSPTLAPLVEPLWTYDGQLSHRFERVLPSGRLQLLVNLHEDAFRACGLDGGLEHQTRGVALQGAHTAPRVVDTASPSSSCGVSFASAGASPLLGMPASELARKLVDLYELWGRDGTILRERPLQAPTSCGPPRRARGGAARAGTPFQASRRSSGGRVRAVDGRRERPCGRGSARPFAAPAQIPGRQAKLRSGEALRKQLALSKHEGTRHS
ncbi:DUF6597 domain-containing transcriptional factor [Comamonas sp. JC664]|uniref:DUF6597 domain-containing transcriptional factor n=1 Tax=Comamonas sp. JC664 TaxID=2801917 RepID=UPI00336A842E